MLEKVGIIERTQENSRFNSPLLCVKQGSKLRICTDARELNKVSRNIFSVIPAMDDLLPSLANKKFFTSIDLCNSYSQIGLDPQSRNKTIFTFEGTRYRHTRLFFGLKQSLYFFQKSIEELLQDLIPCCALVYVDDLLLFSDDRDSHLALIQEVLRRFKQVNLKLQPAKCVFMARELPYLGFLIGQEGLKPQRKNLEKINDFDPPTSKKKLRGFLALANFYRRYTPRFAEYSSTLTELLKSKVKYIWTQEHQLAFEAIKEEILSPKVLDFPNLELDMTLACDASQKSIGCVLQQTYPNGETRAVCFYSKQLSKSQLHYGITQKELLAIYLGIKKFRTWLLGKHFTVISDHRPLSHMLKLENLQGAPLRWVLELQAFDFDVKFVSGEANFLADFMSREDSSVQDESKREKISKPSRTLQEKKFSRSAAKKKEFSVNLTNKITEEPKVRMPSLEEIAQYQREDEKLAPILQHVAGKKLSNRVSDNYFIKQGVLFKFIKDNDATGEEDSQVKVVLPEKLIGVVLAVIHNNQLLHCGFQKTLRRVQQQFSFPNMYSRVKNFVASCHTCTEVKADSNIVRPPHILKDYGTRPFDVLRVDLVGKLPTTRSGNNYYLSIICEFSRFANIIPIPDSKSETVTRAFYDGHIKLFGVPLRVVSDNASTFTCNSHFKAFLQLCGTQVSHVTPYAPFCQGLVERLHKILGTMLRAVTVDPTRWDEEISNCLLAYNNTYHTCHGLCPSVVALGRHIRLPQTLYIPPETKQLETVSEYVERVHTRMNKTYKEVRKRLEDLAEKRVQDSLVTQKMPTEKFREGELVYLFTDAYDKKRGKKFSRRTTGPFVLKQLFGVNARLQSLQHLNKTFVVHLRRLRKIASRDKLVQVIPSQFQIPEGEEDDKGQELQTNNEPFEEEYMFSDGSQLFTSEDTENETRKRSRSKAAARHNFRASLTRSNQNQLSNHSGTADHSRETTTGTDKVNHKRQQERRCPYNLRSAKHRVSNLWTSSTQATTSQHNSYYTLGRNKVSYVGDIFRSITELFRPSHA